MIPYHEETKHTVERLRANRHTLDWVNMPDPFRHYQGVPVLDLPADVPVPRAPMLDLLFGATPAPAATRGAVFLSQLLFYSASISATRLVPSSGYRYALRVNPSSGNLHPTEFHFTTRGLDDWPDGLYHYRVSSHMAEQRAAGTFPSAAPLRFVLAGIAWREAWKYRDRAYRYCLHDIGHAWQSLALAAAALGCEARARGDFDDDELASLYGLGDEWPMLVVEIDAPASQRAALPAGKPAGSPNQLSPWQVEYPRIESMHNACKLRRAAPHAGVLRQPARTPPAGYPATFAEVVRKRRSALDFRGGIPTISKHQFETLLSAATRALDCDFEPSLELYCFVHRVEGLEPGLYRGLDIIRAGDQTVMAAALSLGQALAGNSCVTFSMAARLEHMAAVYGPRGYRYAHFQAGAIGQRLYLAAEALGFQSTGIGAFYDDEVNRYLGLQDRQVVYHFACGYAVPDNRVDP